MSYNGITFECGEDNKLIINRYGENKIFTNVAYNDAYYVYSCYEVDENKNIFVINFKSKVEGDDVIFILNFISCIYTRLFGCRYISSHFERMIILEEVDDTNSVRPRYYLYDAISMLKTEAETIPKVFSDHIICTPKILDFYSIIFYRKDDGFIRHDARLMRFYGDNTILTYHENQVLHICEIYENNIVKTTQIQIDKNKMISMHTYSNGLILLFDTCVFLKHGSNESSLDNVLKRFEKHTTYTSEYTVITDNSLIFFKNSENFRDNPTHFSYPCFNKILLKNGINANDIIDCKSIDYRCKTQMFEIKTKKLTKYIVLKYLTEEMIVFNNMLTTSTNKETIYLLYNNIDDAMLICDMKNLYEIDLMSAFKKIIKDESDIKKTDIELLLDNLKKSSINSTKLYNFMYQLLALFGGLMDKKYILN